MLTCLRVYLLSLLYRFRFAVSKPYSWLLFLLACSNLASAQPVITTNFFAVQRPWLHRYETNAIVSQDLDGDGKADLALGISPNSSLYVTQGWSTPENISFSGSRNYPGVGNTEGLTTGDLNGDGKPDVVTVDSISSTIAVFQNASVRGGEISFSSKSDYSGCVNPTAVLVTDIDGDGKLDMVGISSTTARLSFFRNISVGAAISFAPREEIIVSRENQCGAAEDLDGDGKPDLVLVNKILGTVTLLHNKSTPGNIGFAAQTELVGGLYVSACAVSDLDGDGRKEICLTNRDIAAVSIHKNNSAPGTFSFAARIGFATNPNPAGIAIGDLDGNGKPEIVTCHLAAPNIAVLENLSGSTINFAPKVEFTASGPLSRGGASWILIMTAYRIS